MRTQAIVVAATVFGAANAHFFIKTPTPIPGSNGKPPLEASGSNFPCQGADLTQGTVTNMAAGSQQPLKFDLGGGANWAVHGGGSCQISVTYETEAAKQKDPNNWKVIHSWVGGCPTNAKLNLDPTVVECNGGDGSNCVFNDLTFPIPSEVKNGNAILAWTWFNNIGNREMYMNCAKVAFTGGSGQVDTLPSLFTANIGNGCSTSEQFNTDFPNPGKYVTKDATLNYPLKAPVGTCASGKGSGTAASGTGSSTGASGSAPAAGSQAPAVSSPAPAAASSAAPKKGGKGGQNGGGAFAEGGSSTPTTLATVPAAAPTAASAPASAAPAPAAPASGSCANGGVSCSASGFYCINDSSFGMCNWGCAMPQQMASGTKCSAGAVSRIVNRHHRRHAGVSF